MTRGRAATAEPGTSGWAAKRERGSVLLLRLMFWIALTLGWTVARALLYPITGYFFLASASARAASRDYLGRALGRPARTADVFRHLLTFASTVLDRVFLLAGRDRGYRLEVEGLEVMSSLAARGGGAVLLGAHLGSFEVLRAVGRASPVRVRPLMYRGHWGAMTRLLEALDPALADATIEIGRPDTALRAQESIARGEIIGILADRAPRETRLVEAPFLGSPAFFPAGPFALAGLLQAPVVAFYGIWLGPRHYLVRFELFAERLVLRRATRESDLREVVARYAAGLATVCREHPYNWFNFYPFWEPPAHATTQGEKKETVPALALAAARPAPGHPAPGRTSERPSPRAQSSASLAR